MTRRRATDRFAPMVASANKRGMKLVHIDGRTAEVPADYVVAYPDYEMRPFPEGLKWPPFRRKLHPECRYGARCEMNYRGDQMGLRVFRVPENIKKICMRLQSQDGRDYESVALAWMGSDYAAVPWPDRS